MIKNTGNTRRPYTWENTPGTDDITGVQVDHFLKAEGEDVDGLIKVNARVYQLCNQW